MLKNLTFIDLTHTLTPEIPSWNGTCGFQHSITHDYADSTAETRFRVQQIQMAAGMGTHMDAPAHCIPNAKTIADIPLENLITTCVMIDVSSKAHEKYSVTPQDIKDFEKQHGIIEQNTLALIHTGWEKFWRDPNRYRNNLVFPDIAKETAELLLERNICGIGIDTLSPDRPDDGFPVHQLILGAGKYIIENVANTLQLPPKGAYTFALPIKIKDGTEAPVRLIGINLL